MNIFAAKTQLFQQITGKTSKWLKGWSKVILIILFSIEALSILDSLSDFAASTSTLVEFMITILLFAALLFTYISSLKLTQNAFYGNIAIVSIGMIRAVFYISKFTDPELRKIINEIIDQQMTPDVTQQFSSSGFDGVSFMQTFTDIMIFCFCAFYVVTIILLVLHTIYVLKRKDLFSKSLADLQREVDYNASQAQNFGAPAQQTYTAPEDNF